MFKELLNKISEDMKGFLNPENEFYYVHALCSFFAVVGLALSTIIFLITGFYGSTFTLDLCLENRCFVHLLEIYSIPVAIIKLTGGAIIGIFAFGSFAVASKNYVNSKNSYNSNIHVSNIDIFLTYAHSEITKRNGLKPSSFDLLKLYNTIYPTSQYGTLTISDEYKHKINRIQSTIDSSNHKFNTVSQEKFLYKDHQTEIQKSLADIGISINRMPRLDFYDIEGQIFDFINVINFSFCNLNREYEITSKRDYR